jgi:redox-sensitive bicupin YhaK (pirin superfamily)
MLKKVKYLLPAQEIDMGGFKVKQSLPTQQVQQLDPFLLIHHGKTQFSSLVPAKHQGVDPHPHRGFSPVTFVIEGEVHHRDSRGNNQVAKTGEVQWIHAGAGIIHSERPTESLLTNGGLQEILQIWINSPKDKKMDIPYYVHLQTSDFELETSTDGLIVSKKLSKIGESPLLFYWLKGQSTGKISREIPLNYNTCLYVVNGSISIKGFGLVEGENLVVFEPNNQNIDLAFGTDSEVLIMAGQPIKEKTVQSGPYVMNTETEILEAMRDFQMGKMGILIED